MVHAMFKKIFKLLNDETLYKQTLVRMFKNADIDDLYATYSHKARIDFIKDFMLLMEHYNGDIDAGDLISNAETLLKRAAKVGEMHRAGGTRPDYLFATVKTMARCHEEILLNSDLDRDEVLNFIVNVRKMLDAREIMLVKQWFRATVADVFTHNKELYTQLRQLHNRHKRMLNTLSYPAVITNTKGNVLEMNYAAQNYFAVWNEESKTEIMSLMDFHFATFYDYLKTYKGKGERYMEFTNGDKFISKLVRLNKNSYLITLEKPENKQRNARRNKAGKHSYAKLTYTEAIVSQCVQQGMSSKQIAEKLGLSEETIKTHRKNIRRKLGLVNSKAGLPVHPSAKKD